MNIKLYIEEYKTNVKENKMTPENIGLILIVAYLGWWLYSALGKEQKETEKIEVISGEDGKIIRMKIASPQTKKIENSWNEDEFLQGAKIAFHMIVTAFAKGKKKELKPLLDSKVYDIFIKDIDLRSANKQVIDFSLICLSSAKILKKAETTKEVTVEFISEQINILKNEAGKVLEGDPMNVAKVSDVWTFKKQSGDTWVVSSTKSEVAHA